MALSLSITRRELRPTLALAIPITAGHVGQMLLGIADTVMVGRVGMVPLAGIALANILFHVVFVFGIGMLTAVSVGVAIAHGAEDRHEEGEVMRRGLLLAGLTGIPLAGLLVITPPWLVSLGQDAAVVATATPYLFWVAASMPVALATLALKNFTEALSSPWPAFWTGIVAVTLNVFLNWVFIFGNLGAPALGLTGAGVATFIARLFWLGALFLWMCRDPRFRASLPLGRWFNRINPKELFTMIRLGLPIAIQLFLEVGAFCAGAFLMGWLGTAALAAHQIAITCAATTFMFPMSLAMAVTIRVGHVMGSREPERVAPISAGALGLTLLLAGAFAVMFILGRTTIAGWFTHEPEALMLAAQLLVIAGAFQLADGVQAVAMGALRGLKDVRIPTILVFVAFWLISLPLGSLLAFGTDAGPKGIWYGFSSGLLAVAITLTLRLRRQCKRL
jgi:MATE family multidrug resistance protein